uniref:Zona pellucida sperm-binding protein 3-like n=1 Tax=Fundulus heteroclitus TaxID=8078 RepID=A0A3Q2QQN9_FUNHE
MKWTGEQLTSDPGVTAAVQPSSSLYMVCFCLVMLAFVWLLWRLFHVTLGGPVLRPTWSEEKKSAMNGVPSHSFYRLPVFLHAPTQLVPQELFRPSPNRGPLPAGLTGLLVPPLRQHHSVPDKVARAVEAWCGTEMVSVRVDRILLRAWSVPSLFQIGSCTPSAVTPRYLYFHFGMLECGGHVQVGGGQLVYSYLLNYTPPPQGFVIRVSPINLPIHCYYNRFHYSYKVGFRPQVQHTTFLKSLKSKLTFSLTVCNAQWEPLSPGHTFFLGEQVYFLARAGTLLAGERLYVDSCRATSSEDPSSLPSVDIITNYGCMTDGRREGSNSQFLSGGGSVKFSVDAFLFTGVLQVQYLHCTLSVGLTTSNIAKSCNFNKATVRLVTSDKRKFLIENVMRTVTILLIFKSCFSSLVLELTLDLTVYFSLYSFSFYMF